ncbi:MAG: PD-(D/E)XK nuclease family protein [Bacteroidetes bacterium]|nr:PD-(D/E)XK nuclease family protein [Bacteroidota bacterium]
MESFLNQLAEEVLLHHKEDVSGLCIVFPTRRAGLFFKKHLSSKIDSPQWSPIIFSIQDFIRSYSTFIIPDQLALMFELFDVYKKYFPAESFEKYYPWGEMLLKDFDEVDRNLTEAKQLFAYIKDEKEIDSNFELAEEDLERIRSFWKTFFNKEPGKLRNEFLANWQHLGAIYQDFRKRLEEKKWAYEGLAYRHVAEHPDELKLQPGIRKIIFAGFYALSKSEENIIQHFIGSGCAEIFWDADAYYFDDFKQEAGTFLRNNPLLKPGFKWKQKNFESIEKNIRVIGVPLQVGQAKLAGNLLSELSGHENFSPEQTAVVLPDENLLFPVLYSLPENIDAFNVTMGYPLAATPLFTLFESLILLQKNVRRKKDGSVGFYYKHVMNILHHTSIQQAEGEYIRRWMKMMQDEQVWIQIPLEKLNLPDAPALFRDVFREIKNPDDMFIYFRTLLLHVVESIREKEFRMHEIESEYVYHCYVQLKRLEDVVKQNATELSLDTFWNLYKEIIYSSRIPFSGEPLKGLQVMGFLETRLLDFENLFILSVNEDTLPSSSSNASFIPYNIRKAFNLQTFEEQHAVSSYHFYRLLQRAKNIFLLYNTETKSITAGEKSRYILQLEHELKKKYPGTIHLQHETAVTGFVKTTTLPIVIEKTKDVMSELGRYNLQDGRPLDYSPRISASALISYITCPLKFYFRYVARIKEQEEVEEHIEAAVFGKIFHRAMQLLYGEQTNLSDSVFQQLEKKIPAVVDQSISEQFKNGHEPEGKNILMRNIIVELVQKILKSDRVEAPLLIRFLEKDFFQPIQVSNDRSVLLYGIIDRVDEARGITRIIDYKTGRLEPGKPSSMEEIFIEPKFKEHFQTYFYAYLYWKQSQVTNLKAGLIAVKNLSDGIRFINDDSIITAGQFRQFEKQLVDLVSGLFDTGKPFSQTDDENHCTYCPYSEICHR